MEICVMSPRLRSSSQVKCCGSQPVPRHPLGGCYNKYLKLGRTEPAGRRRLKGAAQGDGKKSVIRRIELIKRIKPGAQRRTAASEGSDGASDRSDRSDTSEGGEVRHEGEMLSWQPRHTVTRRTAQISQEVYSVWHRRVGSSACIPADLVQDLFHDLRLYPSKTQVHEMLECAKDCAGRTSSSYLTFGEFCVFATELKKCYDRGVPRPTQLSRLLEKDAGDETPRRTKKASKAPSKHEVFLGGSCNPTTWRTDVAIPLLKKLDITYFNPQVAQWSPELLEVEHQAKESAQVMFFVIDNQTRGVSALIEVAHIAGRRRKLILVIQSYTQQNQSICDEVISEKEYEDLRNGQEVLQDLVERQGIPVFDTISVAVTCTARVLRENLTVQELGAREPPQQHNGEKLIKLREVFEALDTSDSGELSVEDACCALRMLTNRSVTHSHVRQVLSQSGMNVTNVHLTDLRLDLEQFCTLAAQMRACPQNGSASRSQLSLSGKRTNHIRDVYLGGTGKDTSSWRESIAIPVLKKHGLSFFNPKVCQWSTRLLPIEAAAMEHSYVLLFIITNTARSLSAMAVAGHYIGLGCNVVLCVQMLPPDAVIGAEKLSETALKDYNRGRMYLIDLAKRDDVPVYSNIEEAVECVVRRCSER